MNYLYKHENGILFAKTDKNDLPDLLELKNESWFGTHQVSIVNMTNQEKWLEKLNNEDVNCPKNLVLTGLIDIQNPNTQTFGVEIAGTHPVGIFKIFDIDWQNRVAQLGWDIYKHFRGKGLGKRLVEAGFEFCFKVLNLHRAEAEILNTNIASQKAAEAAGATREGIKKQKVFKESEWVDSWMYGKINTSYL